MSNNDSIVLTWHGSKGEMHIPQAHPLSKSGWESCPPSKSGWESTLRPLFTYFLPFTWHLPIALHPRGPNNMNNYYNLIILINEKITFHRSNYSNWFFGSLTKSNICIHFNTKSCTFIIEDSNNTYILF